MRWQKHNISLERHLLPRRILNRSILAIALLLYSLLQPISIAHAQNLKLGQLKAIPGVPFNECPPHCNDPGELSPLFPDETFNSLHDNNTIEPSPPITIEPLSPMPELNMPVRPNNPANQS